MFLFQLFVKTPTLTIAPWRIPIPDSVIWQETHLRAPKLAINANKTEELTGTHIFNSLIKEFLV